MQIKVLIKLSWESDMEFCKNLQKFILTVRQGTRNCFKI